MFFNSSHYFNEARTYIPGGVNSPVRAFNGVGGTPLFMRAANGPYLYDVDDHEYIDYVGSWGPMILGHRHPAVIASVHEAIDNGLSFGAPTVSETTLAKLIVELMPNIELVRMVNSGTEATMTALRLARGYTGRHLIIKFEGCYHGHSDSLLIKAGSGALTLGQPSSPGIPTDLAKHTITLPYNDLSAVDAAFAQHGDNIAAVIVEPIAGNMGCVLPHSEFLTGLRDMCDKFHAILIFDEVMTGFRVALGGAQARYGICPDLTTLGKIIGGGLPVGAVGGKRAIMQHLAPIGPVYQAGTLSGNPIAMAAGIATLTTLKNTPGFYDTLHERTETLANGWRTLSVQYNIPLCINTAPGMFGLFFTTRPTVCHYDDVMSASVEQFKIFYHAMLQSGVYLAPSAFESGFVSIAHTPSCIARTLEISNHAFQQLKERTACPTV